MTSIATISVPSESVKASAEGLAEHAFSVTNITAGKLSGIGVAMHAKSLSKSIGCKTRRPGRYFPGCFDN